MVLSKIWQEAKWTAETVRGAAAVLADPNAKIPESKLHPRMMAQPWTVGEWVRGNSWRHIWKFVPSVRFYVFGVLGTTVLIKTFFPSQPRQGIKDAESEASAHHHEVEKYSGFRQKQQDKLYFEKYDPLHVTRPDGAALVYGGGH